MRARRQQPNNLYEVGGIALAVTELEGLHLSHFLGEIG
jgi:hypothetical protein